MKGVKKVLVILYQNYREKELLNHVLNKKIILNVRNLLINFLQNQAFPYLQKMNFKLWLNFQFLN